MKADFKEIQEDQIVAIAFAQYYAESHENPDPKAWQSVLSYYGPEFAKSIMAYLHMITFGNLFGNTFDALLSRFKGKPVLESSLVNELGVLIGTLVLFPICIVTRSIRS